MNIIIAIRNYIIGFFYRNVFKPICFSQDPEIVHDKFTSVGEFLGSHRFTKFVVKCLFLYKNKMLAQNVCDINFSNPIGLSAGFDYEAKLTQILSDMGFGFHTVGTITHLPYEGNPKPRLGRLPKSQSLLVNKGFKSSGAKAGIKKLEKLNFKNPIGISIGRTNGNEDVTIQSQAVNDIVSSFKLWEESKVEHSYYELNISCPNLFGSASFYSPQNLDELLEALFKLGITKPVFIKMPINELDESVLSMLKIASKYNFITGVIFGNLQKDRSDPSFVKEEIETATKGHFSGKPTFKRSTELIRLTSKNFNKRFIIIGCGGIFTAKDAYEKIKAGASLLQMITGMIFNGPQSISDINRGLVKLIKKDGYASVSEAVGVDNKNKFNN